MIFETERSYAQEKKIDSLLDLISTGKDDSMKVLRLNALADIYRSTDKKDQVLPTLNKALVLGKKIGYKYGEGRTYLVMGLFYAQFNNYPEALNYDYKALKIFDTLKRKEGKNWCYNNIGVIHKDQQNWPEAFRNFYASLKINKELNFDKGISYNYYNLGDIYMGMDSLDKALEMHQAALKLRLKSTNSLDKAWSYLGIARVKMLMKQYDEAIENNIKSIDLFRATGAKMALAYSFVNRGNILRLQKKNGFAQQYLDSALRIAKRLRAPGLTSLVYLRMVALDSTLGNYKAGFDHQKLAMLYRDSANNEESQKKVLQASMQYEFEKKELAAKARQDQLNVINEEEKRQQQIVTFSVIGGLLLTLVFSVFMYRRFRLTRKQKVLIEEQKKMVDEAYAQLHEKNKEVMDSINYASRIQRALLPTDKAISLHISKLKK
ncbi:MAG: tetratricopeptide repeat protein [Bacteroidia bacterium]